MRGMRALAGLGVAAVLLAACGDDGRTEDTAGTTTTITDGYSYRDSTTTSTTTGAASDAATVRVAEVDGVGQLLVGPNGHTLYLFEQDDGTTSACTGSCASSWPALAAASPTAGDGVDASKLSTADGQVAEQVVYGGHLLYYFAGDAAAGEVKGAGIPDWYPVSPDGEAIDDD